MENQEEKVLKSQEQLRAELSAPLPDEAVTQHPTKTFLSSIKPIYVAERLNSVFGIGKWTLISEVLSVGADGMIVVQSTLTIPDYNITLQSYGGNDNSGQSSKNFDLGDAYKGATSDAFTKICSYLEIGIDVFKGLQTGKPKQQLPPKPTPPAAKTTTIDPAKAQSEVLKKTAQGIANPPKSVEASKALTGTPAAGITPNASFDEPTVPATQAPENKVEQTEEDKRKILLNYLNKVGAAKVLAHLLKVEKLRYVSVGEFVAAEPIDRIKAVYEAVREKK